MTTVRMGTAVFACGLLGGFIALFVAITLLLPQPPPWRFYAGLGLMERDVAVDPATDKRAWKVTVSNQDGVAVASSFAAPDTAMAPDMAVVPAGDPFHPAMEYGLGFLVGLVVGGISLRLRPARLTMETRSMNRR